MVALLCITDWDVIGTVRNFVFNTWLPRKSRRVNNVASAGPLVAGSDVYHRSTEYPNTAL